MSYYVYKAAILRVLPEAAEIPLEAPPTEAFDLQDNQTCPACGSSDATVQVVEDTEVARCPKCECEFPPRLESISRRVIRGISERRERRHVRFMERLSRQGPPNVDQTDYALFKKIVDGPEDEGQPQMSKMTGKPYPAEQA